MKKFLFLAAAVLTSFSASAQDTTLSYEVTDVVGNVYSGTYIGEQGIDEPEFNGVHGYEFYNQEWDGNKFTATIEFPFPISKVDGETNATMITQSTFSGAAKNWHAILEDGVYNIKIHTYTPNINDIATWLWAIYPKFDNGTFSFNIKNIATDTYVYINPSYTLSTGTGGSKYAYNKKGLFTLQSTGTDFDVSYVNDYVRFCFEDNTSTHMHIAINSKNDTDHYLGICNLDGGSNSARNNITFKDVTEYQITISEAGYASIYTPISVYPEGVEAYAVTSITTDCVGLTQMEDIPANNAAIIKGEPGTYTFSYDDSRMEWTDWSLNLLRGTTTNTLVGDDAYVLSAPEGPASVGFYVAAKNKVDGLGNPCFLNNAYKAYLPVMIMYAARCLTFDFGTETGIIETENGNVKTENGDIFDLSGRRVQKAQKGIYVVNGKVVIK